MAGCCADSAGLGPRVAEVAGYHFLRCLWRILAWKGLRRNAALGKEVLNLRRRRRTFAKSWASFSQGVLFCPRPYPHGGNFGHGLGILGRGMVGCWTAGNGVAFLQVGNTRENGEADRETILGAWRFVVTRHQEDNSGTLTLDSMLMFSADSG